MTSFKEESDLRNNVHHISITQNASNRIKELFLEEERNLKEKQHRESNLKFSSQYKIGEVMNLSSSDLILESNHFLKSNNITRYPKEGIDQHQQSQMKLMFRIEVLGGGCSGFKYNYRVDQEYNPTTDIVHFSTFDKEVQVIVDNISITFLENSILDYIIELGQEYFEVRNPNAKSKCGCGISFTL